MKINFNFKSRKAWATLLSAIITAVISILSALGVTVDPTTTSTITSLVATVLSLLTTLGVLYAATDAPDEGEKQDEAKK